jgi:hypothetical protein
MVNGHSLAVVRREQPPKLRLQVVLLEVQPDAFVPQHATLYGLGTDGGIRHGKSSDPS